MEGPVPELSALTRLTTLNLAGNDLCLPDNADLSLLNTDVAAHLRGLNLPSCAVAQQRAALVALYGATAGANWTHSGNWLTDQPLSSWHGVTTDGSGRVTALRLSNNLLVGNIPDLGTLTYLTILDLNTNQLTGPIPALSALDSLTSLNFNSNRLTGPIPALSAHHQPDLAVSQSQPTWTGQSRIWAISPTWSA